MREFIFRGLTENSKWCFGDLLHPTDDDTDYYIEDFTVKKNNCHPVIPETVGQYTGLDDMYEERIFEGDIIMIPFQDFSSYGDNSTHYESAIVYFDNEHHGWYCKFCDGQVVSLWEYDTTDIQIIGNIHERPNLVRNFKEHV